MRYLIISRVSEFDTPYAASEQNSPQVEPQGRVCWKDLLHTKIEELTSNTVISGKITNVKNVNQSCSVLTF